MNPQLVKSIDLAPCAGGTRVQAFVPDADSSRENLDVAAVTLALSNAIRALHEGDGRGALAEAADAFARLALFHR